MLPAMGVSAEAAPKERRVAVVAGNNVGAPGDVPLRFAQRDAARMAQVLTEIGSVSRRDLFLVEGGDAEALRLALRKADELAAAEPAVLIFYYSGHADERALHLGPTRLPWSEVQQFLTRGRARLRIALVDACQAGTLTTPKGFSLGPPLVDSGQRGTAVLASAGSAEVAQEAISLGGSFFTHFLVSGLRGALKSYPKGSGPCRPGPRDTGHGTLALCPHVPNCTAGGALR
jgi:uncharacterized caspase-like protein